MTATVAGVYRPFDAAGEYWFGRRPNAAVPPPRPGESSPQGARHRLCELADVELAALLASCARTRTCRCSSIASTCETWPRARSRQVDRGGGPRTSRRPPNTTFPSLVAASNDQRQAGPNGDPAAGGPARRARGRRPRLRLRRRHRGTPTRGRPRAAARPGLRGRRGPAAAGARSAGAHRRGRRGGRRLAGGQVRRRPVAGPGCQLELRWPVLAAMVGAAVVGLLAVLVTAAPTLRQPLVSLLRRVPPRASALQVGLVEGALVAAAVAGLVTLLTTGRRGRARRRRRARSRCSRPDCSRSPAACCWRSWSCRSPPRWRAALSARPRGDRARRHPGGPTPGAAAAHRDHHGGLRVARLRRRHLGGGRPQPAARAGVETGAPVVLHGRRAGRRGPALGRRSPSTPARRFATPVVTASSVTEGGPRTTAVEPVAFAPHRPLGLGSAPTLSRRRCAASTRTTVEPLAAHRRARAAAGERTDQGRLPRRAGATLPTDGRWPCCCTWSPRADGGPSSRRADRHLRQGTRRTTRPCRARRAACCAEVELRRDVRRLRPGRRSGSRSSSCGSGRRARRGRPSTSGRSRPAAWQSITNENGDQATVDPEHPSRFAATTFGSFLAVQRGDVPVDRAALAAGDVLDRQSADLSRTRQLSHRPDRHRREL